MIEQKYPTATSRRIGELLRERRRKQGYSQLDLAVRIQRRQATISAWENGRSLPSLEDLYDLAYFFDIDVYELLPRRREEPPLRGILRAIHEQFPVHTRFRAALELFLRAVSNSPAPQPTITVAKRSTKGMAARVLKAAGIVEPPVDVLGVARALGVRVEPWEGLDDAISGLLVRFEDGPVIVHNPSHPIERQRFTVAHELGHFLLGHLDEFLIDLVAPIDASTRPGYDRDAERAANNFAAELLMPEPWVRAAHGAGDGDLSAVFAVSDIALGYRLLNLGLVTAPDPVTE